MSSMPRFIDTTTGQFVWIHDVSSIRYAILSHTWRSESDGGEQSYQDVLKIQAAAQRSPPDSSDVMHTSDTLPGPTPTVTPTSILSYHGLSEKIKGICRIAKEAGYTLVWVDSCCIDKSSSAELSEAINSMFRWYALADVCYAYMADVHDRILPPLSGSHSFRSSKWHTRGWTLQELIAPKRVVFLSSTWCFLGTKMSLATVLESVTRIDAAILTGVAPLESVSVARRMSWAAERKTTRLEDEAYCLLGIFGVHMSPIYGEGYSAFIRLQKAIISTVPDQTIFAWGPSYPVHSIPSDKLHPVNAHIGGLDLDSHERGLLARSPRDFLSARDTAPLSLPDYGTRLGLRPKSARLPSLHCVFTPEGVCLQLCCVYPAHFSPTDGRPWRGYDTSETYYCIAFLRCEGWGGGVLALPLYRPLTRVQEGLAIGYTKTPHPLFAPRYRVMHLSLSTVSTLMRAWMFSPYASPFIRAEQSAITSEPCSQSIPRNPQHTLPSRCQLAIAPLCEDELRVVGFEMTCLRLISFGVTETYTIILYANTTGSSGPHGVKTQSIRITVSFPSSGSWPTEAIFSILHSFPVSTAHAPPSSSIPTAYTPLCPDGCMPPSPIMPLKAQNIDTSDMRNRRAQGVPLAQNQAGTICQTSWELQADPAEWFSSEFGGRDERGTFARLLRLTLRATPNRPNRAPGTCGVSRITKVELGIELSDRYWQERRERLWRPEPLPAPSYYNHILWGDSTSTTDRLLHEHGNQRGVASRTASVGDESMKPRTDSLRDFLDSHATDSMGTSDHSSPPDAINLSRKSGRQTPQPAVDGSDTRRPRSEPVLDASSTLALAAPSSALSDDDRAGTTTRGSCSSVFDKRPMEIQDGVDTRTFKRRRARKYMMHHSLFQEGAL
ncbi:hypothetical protein C8Q78DRAFT_180363 [Trametes maxima]|nr:hypothetical protein C8Q78DRAFT_180363 [Trametes maxima]